MISVGCGFVELSILLVMSTIISIIKIIAIAYTAIIKGSALVVPSQDLISFPPNEWRELQFFTYMAAVGHMMITLCRKTFLLIELNAFMHPLKVLIHKFRLHISHALLL